MNDQACRHGYLHCPPCEAEPKEGYSVLHNLSLPHEIGYSTLERCGNSKWFIRVHSSKEILAEQEPGQPWFLVLFPARFLFGLTEYVDAWIPYEQVRFFTVIR